MSETEYAIEFRTVEAREGDPDYDWFEDGDRYYSREEAESEALSEAKWWKGEYEVRVVPWTRGEPATIGSQEAP